MIITCQLRTGRSALITSIILMTCLSAGCSSLNMRNDYWNARSDLRRNYPESAKSKLPTKEKGTFIDLMERTYLSLLAGNPDIDGLLNYSHRIDNQVRYKVSKEIKSLFYVETPEGYYASEHEIIWMHLLLSWGFSMRRDFESAAVEAKIASNLLQSKWSPEGRFDDPFIRIVLGALWAMSGDWENARVDFRAAYKLDNKLKWAQTLADMDSKPAQLIIILGGTGPEPRWAPNGQRGGIRDYQRVRFEMAGVGSDLLIEQKQGIALQMHKTPDAMRWYLRHYDRNSTLNEVIGSTRYANKAVIGGLGSAAIATSGVLIGAAVIAGGAGVAVLVVKICFEIGLEKGAIAAIVPALAGLGVGGNIIYKSFGAAGKNLDNTLDESDSYRFVRFLPEYAWLHWSKKSTGSDIRVIRKTDRQVRSIDIYGKVDDGRYAPQGSRQTFIMDMSDRMINGVFIGFFPDAN